MKLRLDPDIVEGFKSTEPGWQTLINDTLRTALKRDKRGRVKIGSVGFSAKRTKAKPAARRKDVLDKIRAVSKEIVSDPSFLKAMGPTGMEPYYVRQDSGGAI